MLASIFENTIVTNNWQEVQQSALEGAKVLFPLGVIEEHGPHLPLGADIYWSYNMCRMVKEKLESKGEKSIIAPPYYWGVNYCTGGFPGSFSLKPETMQQVLFELLENLKNFNFEKEIELSAEDIRLAARALGKITGRFEVDEILDKIFGSFCIGK